MSAPTHRDPKRGPSGGRARSRRAEGGVRPGATLEGSTRDLAFGGDGVVATERGVFLVPGTLPGERVRIEVEAGHRPPRARLLELIEPSPDRVPAPCPIVERCGGCPLMQLSPAAQLRLKAEWVEHALAPVGRPETELVAAATPLGYRRRARMQWRAAPRALGFVGQRSRHLVDVDRCVVLDPVVAAGLALVRTRLLPHLAGDGDLALGVGAGARAVARIRSDCAQRGALYDAARAAVADRTLAGLVLELAGAAGGSIGDPRERALGIDGAELVGPAAGGFAQAHREINEVLVARVASLAAAGGRRVLELYAGHGNLTVALARDAARVVAVEADADAASACRENLAARALGSERARVVASDAAAFVEHARKGEHDVLVVDPPRRGMDEPLLARLTGLRFERIVYVSCSPPALRRDVGVLAGHGYRAERAVVLEMFPQTSHVEAVVSFVR